MGMVEEQQLYAGSYCGRWTHERFKEVREGKDERD